MAWWLQTPDGGRVPIQGGGVLLGRAPDSEIVLNDERASRRHALVHVLPERPSIVALGRGTTTVNGQVVTTEHPLEDGATIAVPGLELTVKYAESPTGDRSDEWILQRLGGGLYGISQSPFSVGDRQDALSFEGWTNKTLVFWRTDAGLSVEVGRPIQIDGEPASAGQVVRCGSGTRIEVDGDVFQLLSSVGHGMASTVTDDEVPTDALPARARLTFLPRGARLFLTDRHGERGVYLPERRAELISLLLAPPEPYAAGELIPDELMLERLWPRQTKTPNDLHVLVHRARKSLVAAGIDGAALIARDPQAGGTRFALAPGANVAIE